ncbi:MAG: vacuolar ATPase assembly integral membrane protein vma21 [Claussenomyces sp. TS43310]|nr:MAG: vacuolar ATPase assembly integral membrane protein vma21 [Claussenomyces sp. TS43310]
MTTRRIVDGANTILEKDDNNDFSPAAGEKSNITPAVPAHVIFKLLGFTLAMIAGPLLTYFSTVNLVFKGKTPNHMT